MLPPTNIYFLWTSILRKNFTPLKQYTPSGRPSLKVWDAETILKQLAVDPFHYNTTSPAAEGLHRTRTEGSTRQMTPVKCSTRVSLTLFTSGYCCLIYAFSAHLNMNNLSWLTSERSTELKVEQQNIESSHSPSETSSLSQTSIKRKDSIKLEPAAANEDWQGRLYSCLKMSRMNWISAQRKTQLSVSSLTKRGRGNVNAHTVKGTIAAAPRIVSTPPKDRRTRNATILKARLATTYRMGRRGAPVQSAPQLGDAPRKHLPPSSMYCGSWEMLMFRRDVITGKKRNTHNPCSWIHC